ncbi:helix-turn-helix domain-containing protein [Lactobacillus johnsonii]|uniref:helix-turn-helix domain-containing protein n=1 Tax=Lactobacillus johnsonii TaxID=33959 RepID=UPI0022E17EB6|nr:helix-turn-helix transcriptional regulator [Lactobacillus johnsonii]
MTAFTRVKELAKIRKLSLREVNDKAGLGKNSIYKWKTSAPSIENASKVAKVLNTSADYLMGKTDNPAPVSDKISDADLDEMLDNARSFDGKPMTDHDRELIRSYLKGLYDAK